MSVVESRTCPSMRPVAIAVADADALRVVIVGGIATMNDTGITTSACLTLRSRIPSSNEQYPLRRLPHGKGTTEFPTLLSAVAVPMREGDDAWSPVRSHRRDQ